LLVLLLFPFEFSVLIQLKDTGKPLSVRHPRMSLIS